MAVIVDNLDAVIQSLTAQEVRAADLAKNAVVAAGLEAINYARSYTQDTVPGLRKDEGPRLTHPGGWSDRTNNLRQAYSWRLRQVAADPFIIVLVLSNSMEYAKYLEARGYWVLSGLFEGYLQARVAYWIKRLFRR